MKTERRQIHFLSDVFAAIASLDLTVPIIIIADNTVLVFIIILVIITFVVTIIISCYYLIITIIVVSLTLLSFVIDIVIFSNRILFRLSFQLLKDPVVQGIFSEKSNPRQKSLKHPYISLSLYNVQM